MEADMQPKTLAQATLTHRDGSTTVITVTDSNTFSQFYRFEFEDGSARYASRTTARTLEDLAEMQVAHFSRLAKHHPRHAGRAVVDMQIEVEDHSAYMDRIEAAPDELGDMPVMNVSNDIALYCGMGQPRKRGMFKPNYTTLQRKMDIITGRA